MIKVIFTNILFVMGVGFAIFGFIRGTLTLTRLFVFDTYPLPSYEETRCELEMTPLLDKEGTSVLAPADLQERRRQCQASLEKQRNIRKAEDVVLSVSTLIVGTILILSFKRFIFISPVSASTSS